MKMLWAPDYNLWGLDLAPDPPVGKPCCIVIKVYCPFSSVILLTIMKLH